MGWAARVNPVTVICPKQGSFLLVLWVVCVGATIGCTPSYLDLVVSPEQAITKAKARLRTRGIPLDLANGSHRHFRTVMVCFVDADRFGFSWDRAFGHVGRGPITFAVVGPDEKQQAARKTCPYQFRVTIRVENLDEGSRLTTDVGWWRLTALECRQETGNLLGNQHCRYAYRGSRAPRDVKGFIYGLLRSL
jgi:hypothetical protein